MLIVDGAASERARLATLLGHAGYEVGEASTGAEALALARERIPDAVIADALMPGMDGYELVRRLRADPDTATQILQSAGFANVRRTAHQIEVEVPEDSVVDEAQLRFVGIPEDKLAAAQAAVDAHMQQFKLENGLSRFPLAFQLLEADNA